MKTKIFVFGLNGKMGQELSALIEKAESPFKLVRSIKEARVVVDFSSPEGFMKLLKESQKHSCAIVSGTTGLSKKDLDTMKQAGKNKPVLWASNFSPGLWMFREALKAFKYAEGFDFSIDEVHHTAKRDNPSGTAITLHQDLEKISKRKIAKPLGQRIGGVVGIHTVQAASQYEVLRFEHTAMNRRVFAQGALDAALWIVNQGPGLYSMDDFMGDRK